MSDCIFIEELRVPASIGVYEWEKLVQQELIIDCSLELSLSAAGASDQLDDTVSYADVAQAYMELIQSQHHDLLEHLADKLVAKTFDTFAVTAVELKISKPSAVPEAKSVGIRIRRTRPE